MAWTVDSGIAALLGALIGGVISWLATWSMEIRKERRQAKALALAAASEIDATLLMLKSRDWRGDFVEALAKAEIGELSVITVHVRDGYLPMCRAAMSHAGVISRDLSVYLARFMALADGLLSDLKRMAENMPGTSGSLFDDTEGAKKAYSNLIEIWDAGFHVGGEAVTLVDRLYPRHAKGFLGRVRRAWNVIISGTP